jgi:hypothetical protein
VKNFTSLKRLVSRLVSRRCLHTFSTRSAEADAEADVEELRKDDRRHEIISCLKGDE